MLRRIKERGNDYSIARKLYYRGALKIIGAFREPNLVNGDIVSANKMTNKFLDALNSREGLFLSSLYGSAQSF